MSGGVRVTVRKGRDGSAGSDTRRCRWMEKWQFRAVERHSPARIGGRE